MKKLIISIIVFLIPLFVFSYTIDTEGNLDNQNNRLTNLANGINNSDGVNLGQMNFYLFELETNILEVFENYYTKTEIDEKLENVSVEEETQNLINLTISDIDDDTTNINYVYENSTENLSIQNLNETHTQLSNFKEMCIYEENNQTIIKMELC